MGNAGDALRSAAVTAWAQGRAEPAGGYALSGKKLGVVFLEDRREVGALACVKRLDQAMDPRRHHEQVVCGLSCGVPVGMRRAAPDQQRIAGANLALLLAHAKPEPPLEHDPGLVVGAVQVQGGDRSAG